MSALSAQLAPTPKYLCPGDLIRDYNGKAWRFRRAICASHDPDKPGKVVGQVEVEHGSGGFYKVFYDCVFPGLIVTTADRHDKEITP